jgi:hypothetical protein
MNRAIFLLFVATFANCLAQSSDEAPPGNPTQFPSGDAKWTVTWTYRTDFLPNPKSANFASQKIMKSMEVTRIGKLQQQVTSWSNGQISQNWYFPKNRFTITTNTSDGSAVVISDFNGIAPMLLQTGFDPSGFIWIDPKYFKGVESYQGTTCYHYKGTVMKSVGLRGETKAFNLEAWIDKKALLPVALDDGVKLGVFAFDKEAPKGHLVPPKEIQEAFLDNAPGPGPWAEQN